MTNLLQNLIAHSRDGMLAFDRDCRYVLWNRVMEEISGLRSHEVVGKVAFDVFPFLVENGEEGLMREALAGREAHAPERPFLVEATGKSGVYEAHYAPWHGEGGLVMGGVAVIRDVTNVKRVELERRESEQRFRNMADVAPVLLWMSGPDGLCTFFNQTWLDFTGRSLAEEWGVGWAEGVHFEDFQRCMDTYLDAFNRRALFEMEYRLRRKDGQFRWILDRGTPRYLPDGTFAGFIGSCVDITELKVLEIELRQAVRGRDEFLSIASHELQTPLATLLLQLEGLMRAAQRTQDDKTITDRALRSADMALKKARHLTEMVNTLLDVSRLTEERLSLQRADVDLAAVVREVTARLEPTATQAGCTLRLQVDSQARGWWDAFRVGQVVTNLLSNAIKYASGQPIDVSVEADDGTARLRVADHGPGIPPEQQPIVFERFARFMPTRNYGGFGLGLWITREIVKAHGGEISLVSAPGQGATFIVELPVGASPDGR